MNINPSNKFSEEFGNELARMYASGLTGAEVGRRMKCSPSSVINWAERVGVPLRWGRQERVVVESKKCKTCEIKKRAKDFPKNKENIDGLFGWCKSCEIKRKYDKDPNWREVQAAWNKRRRKQRPEEYRATGLRKRFRMSMEDFHTRLQSQGNACLGCGEKPDASKGFWHVDHDHSCCPGQTTCGKCVRGVLCRSCNTAMGILKDDSKRLRKLAEYLEFYHQGPGEYGKAAPIPLPAAAHAPPSVPIMDCPG